MSDLAGTQIVGFLTHRLKYYFVFTVPYTACGNTFTFNTTWSREIDPLVEDPPVPNYHARHLPQLEWEANSTEMFTLIAHDIGYLYNHGVYINIQGNDLIGLIQSHPENVRFFSERQISCLITSFFPSLSLSLSLSLSVCLPVCLSIWGDSNEIN